jgi:sulfofructosephosphate aldolase
VGYYTSMHGGLNTFIKDGRFAVLAFDHRGSFVKMMQAHTKKEVGAADATALKGKIIAALSSRASGMLLDEEYGLPAYKQLGITVPYLLPAEKTGYTDQEGERVTVTERTAAELKEQGAHAVKLLLYVHHGAASWEAQMQTARNVIEDAHGSDLPVFLEFVLYSPPGKGESSVVEVVGRALAQGVLPDVWKLPYPGSREDAEKVSALVEVTPWVLLTGGGTFEEFLEHYKESVTAGASGFVAGRSLWQEACELFDDEAALQTFLSIKLVERFDALTEV